MELEALLIRLGIGSKLMTTVGMNKTTKKRYVCEEETGR